jgi:hypothetical protein
VAVPGLGFGGGVAGQDSARSVLGVEGVGLAATAPSGPVGPVDLDGVQVVAA